MDNDQGFWPLELPENEKVTAKTLKLIEQQKREIGELKIALTNRDNRLALYRDVEKQNQQLAAHIERCNSDTDKALHLIERIYSGGFSLNEFEQPVHDLLVNYEFAKSPQISLAEHDREVKAKQAKKSFLSGCNHGTVYLRKTWERAAQKHVESINDKST